MAQSCLRHITLEVNCGFSRTAIRQLTNRNEGCRNDSDAQNRALEFQNLFKDCPKYFQNRSYFDSCGYNGSQFDRDCKSVLLHFHKKWHPKETLLDYEKQFSIENWKALPMHKQKGHTMPNVKHAEMNTTTINRTTHKDHTSIQCPYFQ